jgi:hypothetical protein
MRKVRAEKQQDRRLKARFPFHRQMHYKILKRTGGVVRSGDGHTLDISSGGVAFAVDHEIPLDAYVELSISWPVLLNNNCPMQLIVYGCMLRCGPGHSVCSVEKYEFRTKARVLQPAVPEGTDMLLKELAEGTRKTTAAAHSGQLLA